MQAINDMRLTFNWEFPLRDTRRPNTLIYWLIIIDRFGDRNKAFLTNP